MFSILKNSIRQGEPFSVPLTSGEARLLLLTLTFIDPRPVESSSDVPLKCTIKYLPSVSTRALIGRGRGRGAGFGGGNGSSLGSSSTVAPAFKVKVRAAVA